MSTGKNDEYFFLMKGERAEIQLIDEPRVAKDGRVFVGEHVRGHSWRDQNGRWTFGQCDGTSTCQHCQQNRNIVNKYKVRIKVFWQEGGATGKTEDGRYVTNDGRHRWGGKDFILDMQASLSMRVAEVYKQVVEGGLMTHEDFMKAHFVVEKLDGRPWYDVQFIAPNKVTEKEEDPFEDAVADVKAKPSKPKDRFDEVFGDEDLDFKATNDAPKKAEEPQITFTNAELKAIKRAKLAYKNSPLPQEEKQKEVVDFLKGAGFTSYEAERALRDIEADNE